MKKSIGSLVFVAMVSSSAAFADTAWVSCRKSGGELKASVSPNAAQISALFENDAFFEKTLEIGEPEAPTTEQADVKIHLFKPTFQLWYHGKEWKHTSSVIDVENDNAQVSEIVDGDVKQIIKEQVTKLTDVETFVRTERGFYFSMVHGIFPHRAFIPAGVDSAYVHFHSFFSDLDSVGMYHHKPGSTVIGSAIEIKNGVDCLVSVVKTPSIIPSPEDESDQGVQD